MSEHLIPTGPRAALRRPPAPRAGLASVTRLAPEQQPDTPVPLAAVQGTLALDLRGSTGMPGTPELRVVRAEPSAEEVQGWAARFAQAVVEVVGGDRPLSQLLRWTNRRVYADLDRRVRILSRATPPGQRVRTVRPQVRSVHVFQPTADTAEVSVHVRHGRRSRAIAARLERADGRWRCTALQFG